MKRATRDSAARILAVARRRFEAFGYRRTNIAEIARDAGVAPGTIYRHFESKEDLLRRVVEESNAEWLEEARRALGGEGTAIERLLRLGQASIEFNRRHKLLGAVLDRDHEIIFAPLLDELLDKLLEQNVAMMAEVIRGGIEAGALRPVDPEKAAFILFVAGNALFGQQRVAYADVLPVFAEIAVKGLLDTRT
jgi:AcrR family transcriptional regulator